METIPRPRALTGACVLDLLDIAANNHQQRREFGACLAQVAGAAWSAPDHTDGEAWGEALARFLSSHQAWCQFTSAVERHHGGRQDQERRLNLLAGIAARAIPYRRRAGQAHPGWREGMSDLDLIRRLLARDEVEAASLVFWWCWLSMPVLDRDSRALLDG